MELPKRDGDGYLESMDDWTPEIAKAMAESDNYELNDEKWAQILKAREFYEEFGSVPPIRKFAKYIDHDQKGSLRTVDDRPDEAHHQIRRPAETDRLRLIFTVAADFA